MTSGRTWGAEAPQPAGSRTPRPPAARAPGAGVRIGRGPRDGEARLLGELAPLLEAARANPRLLSAPVRVVVPSRSLRLHLAARLVRHFGGAVAGLAVQTLHGVAREITERSDVSLPGGGVLLPVLVRRHARSHPPLRAALEPLADGYLGVEATVADFLDAGLDEAAASAVEERLSELPLDAALRARVRALVRVAASCARALEGGALFHGSRLFRAAARSLARDPATACPARAVFVYGFADATGVQADLIELLVRRLSARVFLDRPPDPADRERVDLGTGFGARFAERLLGVAGVEPDARGVAALDAARVALLHAPGPSAEVREVASRVRALLDAGVVPERVAVVARSLAPYAVILRLHLGRLGVPFSGIGAPGPATPGARRVAALLELLRRGPRAPAERWLEAQVALPSLRGRAPRIPDGARAALGRARLALGDGERADLRLAFHARGTGRLADVAELAAEDAEASLALPVRMGLVAAGEESAAPRAPHRRLDAGLLRAAAAAGRSLCARLEAWPALAPGDAHRRALRDLVFDGLGWAADGPEAEALAPLLDEEPVPPPLPLSADEFRLCAERALAGAGRAPLGGEGAGVQVLDALEARMRSFDHLFVIGLERDVFPRGIHEDPLLPDAVRRPLRDVLPDLPVKSEGHDEERFLFAQLLAASPDVTLSCSLADEDGAARQPSPLLARMRGVAAAEVVPAPDAPAAADAAAGTALRPAHEHALLAGLHGGRGHFAAVLRAAAPELLAESGVAGDSPDPAAFARARLAVLAELDPRGEARARLGPYFGFVGAPREAADPRRAPLFVTGAERLAACPWQGFLGRLLRLELLPDALDALPAAEPRSVGAVVHAVLERILRAALLGSAEGDGAGGGSAERDRAEDLADVVRREPVPAPWPAADAYEALLQHCAAEVARAEGVGVPGFSRVLAERARPYLEVARVLDGCATEAGVALLGAEVRGALDLGAPGGATRRLHFRADRVERRRGRLVLTDYKTGAPLSTARRAEARAEQHAARVASGRMLQAVAYALAAAATGDAGAEGRYLYLGPGLDAEARSFPARADDAELAGRLADAAATVFDVVERGSFFPRLEKTDGVEPRRCQSCEVRDACLRGDSGARARLAGWVRDAGAAPPAGAAERALAALWERGGRDA